MKIKTQNKAGGVLVLVMVLVLLLGGLGGGLMKLSSGIAVEVSSAVNEASSFWVAEAGIEHVKAIGQIKRKPFGYSPAFDAYSSHLLGLNVFTGTTVRGTYYVSVVGDPNNYMHGLKDFDITSRGVVNAGGVSFTNTITEHAKIQSFGSYMHATAWEQDRSGNNLWFTTGDVIDGPVYVNDQLNIQNSPRFLQLVSSAASSVNYSSANSSVFEGQPIPLKLNATPISGQFTGDHITDIKTAALGNGTGGLSLTNDWYFVFKTNSFTYQQGATIRTNTVLLSNTNGGLIYVSGNATVRGVVNGKVTLAAQKSIFITNDLVYASAQSPNPWSGSFTNGVVDDYIGLVASNSVILTMSNAVNIHAAIMVTSGASTGLEGFSALYNANNFGHPNINLFGSLSQYRRGLIWSSSSVNGFAKNYKFDSRLLNDAPPSFPYSVYVYTGWQKMQ